MVSSLMMGLAMGMGGVMTPLVGKLADIFSIRSALFVVALVPLASLCLVAILPEKKLREQPST